MKPGNRRFLVIRNKSAKSKRDNVSFMIKTYGANSCESTPEVVLRDEGGHDRVPHISDLSYSLRKVFLMELI